MLSDSDKKLLRLSTFDSETRSRSLCSSVNDIYSKMKKIRRSLENMENVVGKQLTGNSFPLLICGPLNDAK